jgi:hypothetical protein
LTDLGGADILSPAFQEPLPLQTSQSASIEHVGTADPETTVSLSHFVHTLRAYRIVIVLSMIAVAIAYALVALILLLRSPAQKTTSIPFRLDF